ncbi:hypothetical protein RIB2604_01400010 [Aspergillus luchuensis]|uniref:Uncharacterized protein n=1 Tax=Aspergillus kawachii TaxID=1069201 RepID=A0A146F6Z3_ASPKA|nr:hypothetical protein RIB2604_01400010 [Aspergillus luchuensis]
MSDTTDRKLEGPLRDICDGACGIYWTYADNFYLCKECDYIKFDQRCLDNLRNGTMKLKICNKDHEMLHIPAYDPVERRRVGDGNVKVGEEILRNLNNSNKLVRDIEVYLSARRGLTSRHRIVSKALQMIKFPE